MRRLAYGLGESPFDAEVYNIDANGKHRFFYTGFERHELDYRPGTNQVDKIKINYDALGKEFVMRHNGQGNVGQSLHKDIDRIEYDATSQRASSLRMTDGRLVTFAYVKSELFLQEGQVPLGFGRRRSNQNDFRPGERRPVTCGTRTAEC